MRKIHDTFGSWPAAWAHVERLGLDPGVQADPRPRYATVERVARGMAEAENRLGCRPTSSAWTGAVRDLKRELGPGVIPGKPTIYRFFASWKAAWSYVDVFRSRGVD